MGAQPPPSRSEEDLPSNFLPTHWPSDCRIANTIASVFILELTPNGEKSGLWDLAF
jgi:hypothetical protein